MRVAVVTGDPIGERMPGPAIRAWHLATELARRHEVVLTSTVSAGASSPHFEVRLLSPRKTHDLESWMDAAVVAASVVEHCPALLASAKPIVVDLYDPYHLENLELGAGLDTRRGYALIAAVVNSLNVAMKRGDFFLAASERQRDFWLGALATLGRVNPGTYRHSSDLRGLIDVLPYGLSDVPASRVGAGLRGVVPGIGEADPIVLWGGGIYDWFDPQSAIRAVDILRHELPDVRLVFMGTGHPNPAIPPMKAAADARSLADSLGLTGKHIIFLDGWVPYEERVNVLLDSDVGLSLHMDHVEARFSFRTRVLDYLWAGVPMVMTQGDTLAKMMTEAGLGRAVPPGDPVSIAAAIHDLLVNRPRRELYEVLAADFTWQKVAEPLMRFLEAPTRARDTGAFKVNDSRMVRIGSRLRVRRRR